MNSEKVIEQEIYCNCLSMWPLNLEKAIAVRFSSWCNQSMEYLKREPRRINLIPRQAIYLAQKLGLRASVYVYQGRLRALIETGRVYHLCHKDEPRTRTPTGNMHDNIDSFPWRITVNCSHCNQIIDETT